MPFKITYHAIIRNNYGIIPVLGPQLGDREDLTVGASAQNGADRTVECLAKILATEAGVLQIGTNAVADANKSEPWAANQSEVRYIPSGARVSVKAAS